MIGILNYGVGNLGSIGNMLKKIGAKYKYCTSSEEVISCSKILLPGVGAFDTAMSRLQSSGLIPVIEKKVFEEKCPILGICLGMQLLTEGSEEGSMNGLGWIKGRAWKFVPESDLRVPHMGWNFVKKEESMLTDGCENSKFYFVHSYFVKVDDATNSIFTCNYGEEFDAGIQKDNIMGVQFHPEKSHRFGMKVLNNFSKLA